jgi:hypothetical protein
MEKTIKNDYDGDHEGMTMMNGDIGEEEEIMTPDEGYKR